MKNSLNDVIRSQLRFSGSNLIWVTWDRHFKLLFDDFGQHTHELQQFQIFVDLKKNLKNELKGKNIIKSFEKHLGFDILRSVRSFSTIFLSNSDHYEGSYTALKKVNGMFGRIRA